MKWKTRLMSLDTIYLPNIEHKLEKMAAQGWMLFEVFRYTMIFQSCEPQFIRFNILLNPENRKEKSNTGPIGELETLCEEAGWHFHSRYGTFILFTSSDPTLAAIHTDRSILIQSVVNQITKSLFSELILLFAFLYFSLYPILTMTYMDATNSVIIIFTLGTILVMLFSLTSFVPQLIWWGMNRKRGEDKLFLFSDKTYTTVSFLFLLNWIIVFNFAFSQAILKPIPGINLTGLLVPVIALSPVLFLSWKRESENKQKVPDEIAGMIALVIILSIFFSFGGITLFTGDLFSGKQAIRISDVSNSVSLLGTLDNATEIGPFAIKKVDAFDTAGEWSVNTLVKRFYSNEKASLYWDLRLKDLIIGENLTALWGIEGYYFDNHKGIILRKGKEVIEITAEIDISNPNYINRMKTRLGLQEGN